MDELQVKYNSVAANCADLNAQLNAMLLDDSSTPEDVQKLKDSLDVAKARRDALNAQIKALGAEPTPEPAPKAPTNGGKNLTPAPKDGLDAKKQSILDFMQRKPAKNQVSTTEMSPVIPEEIIYNPDAEVKTVVDLGTLVQRTPVTTAKGTYPIKKRADDFLATTEELKANPELAAPSFDTVDWSVDTHRGALTISQEAIDDADPSVLGIVGEDIDEKRVNTHNHVIAPLLKSFSAKAVTLDSDHSVDDIKDILNVQLDPGYVPVIIASQSFYNALDTLKDKQGQYIFHQDITTPGRGTLLGVPVYRVGDDLIGEKQGDQAAFIGDVKRAIFFADRKEVNLTWEYDQVYGQYLAAVLRFGATVADKNAGFYVTAGATATDNGTTTDPKA
jgi:HK97 family phage major capsid protein